VSSVADYQTRTPLGDYLRFQRSIASTSSRRSGHPPRRHVVKGRGKFQKRRVVEGTLEIRASGSTDDARLRGWIDESRVVLPLLHTMLRRCDRGTGLVRLALEDLRRRVEAVERELARLRCEHDRS